MAVQAEPPYRCVRAGPRDAARRRARRAPRCSCRCATTARSGACSSMWHAHLCNARISMPGFYPAAVVGQGGVPRCVNTRRACARRPVRCGCQTRTHMCTQHMRAPQACHLKPVAKHASVTGFLVAIFVSMMWPEPGEHVAHFMVRSCLSSRSAAGTTVMARWWQSTTGAATNRCVVSGLQRRHMPAAGDSGIVRSCRLCVQCGCGQGAQLVGRFGQQRRPK